MNAKEALESLRLWANHQTWGNDRKEIIAALSSLVEENEKARAIGQTYEEYVHSGEPEREQAEADARYNKPVSRRHHCWDIFKCPKVEENAALKAELDAARPLLEAALGPCENRVTYAYRVNEAALAYRAKMEGKEKGQ